MRVDFVLDLFYTLFMQSEFAFMRPSRLAEVHHHLLKAHIAAHGPLDEWLQLDPVSQMVLAILDGRTRDEVSMRVFDELRYRFVWWNALLNMSTGAVEQLIRPVTFAERKAGQLQRALQKITNFCGTLNLDFLGDRSVEDARSWLEDLPGVGPKVSAAVVNFSTLHMRALVIDSHYLRVAKRLGLVERNASDKAANRSLARQVPSGMTADDLQQHYFVVKCLGQNVCRYSSPNCRACPLRNICPTGKRSCGES